MPLYRKHKKAAGPVRSFIRANKKQLGILALIAAAALLIVFLSMQMAAQQKYESSFLVTNDTIKIGIRVGAPGFGEINENGEIVGFDRDYIDAVLKELVGDSPKIYEYVPLTSQDAGAAIKYDEAQICLGQLSTGLLQTTGFTLTDPYYMDRVVAVVKDDSPLTTIRSLAGGLGLLQTSLSATVTTEQLEKIGIDVPLTAYSDYESALTDLAYGRIQAVLMPYETARQFTSDGFRILTEELFQIGYRILLPSAQQAVAREMNTVISRLAENGTTGVLRTEWNV